ncbi:MAG: B12-binding domain-containing radical SAM protein [Planctomycetes bacterium]|nr:B12-binding domain-containing radical SAM protein [Planctomycetota bacterium]
MAKVLLINPVIRIQDKPRHIPYGIAQLAAIASRKGHQIQVFDANGWRPTDSEIIDVLKADNWDVIATGGLVTTYGFIKKVVSLARQACPSSLIVVGGGVITPIPFEIMTFLAEVDVGVVGEGYITFPEILERLDNGTRAWSDVKGIIWRDIGGKLHLNSERPLLNDVDSLPFPAWEFFPLEIYFRNSSILLSEESMLSKRRLEIACSYGCRFMCKYCFHLGLSDELTMRTTSEGNHEVVISKTRNVRHHSAEYVIELVKYARNRFGVDFISFLDENFVSLSRNNVWYDEFSKRWEESGLIPECVKKGTNHDPVKCSGVHWGTTAHAALASYDILKNFKRLGCAYLDYGLESFDDGILKSIGKGSNARINEQAIIHTLKAGIRPVPNQIIGFPGETFESILVNVDAWNRLGIQSYPFFATPYPGTEWYYSYKDKILEQYEGKLEDFLLDLGDATRITAVISENFNAVELLGLRELMVNRDVKRILEYKKIWKKQKSC